MSSRVQLNVLDVGFRLGTDFIITFAKPVDLEVSVDILVIGFLKCLASFRDFLDDLGLGLCFVNFCKKSIEFIIPIVLFDIPAIEYL